MYKGEEYADGEVPGEVEVTQRTKDSEFRGLVFIETQERWPREFYIKESDADKHAYTRGCEGCASWHRGLARQPHSEESRNRFLGLLNEEARVVNADGRKKDFEDRELGKKRRK